MENVSNPTRKEILALLKKSNGLTVIQLSQALGISAMGVRQHLGVLEKDGYIAAGKRRGRMGRPAHIYSLTEKGEELLPRRYDTLAMDILEALDDLGPPALIESVFRRRGERIEAHLGPRVTGTTLPQRLEEVTRLQKELGYMAEWNMSSEGYQLTLYNCPIARVSKRYPIVCKLEHQVFERLIGSPMERRKCMSCNGTSCNYFIKNGNLKEVSVP